MIFCGRVSSTDRQMKIYGGLYHEIFNEYCRDGVISDTLRWMRRRLNGEGKRRYRECKEGTAHRPSPFVLQSI